MKAPFSFGEPCYQLKYEENKFSFFFLLTVKQHAVSLKLTPFLLYYFLGPNICIHHHKMQARSL